ncbi:hypothetical protein [Streptomyces sp. NPDC046261]|uniref:hypothetical protein n=1 Tax=Streptomyces sp. NPDC046261 TaxID=3157200 RepID=UPI0033FF78B2
MSARHGRTRVAAALGCALAFLLPLGTAHAAREPREVGVAVVNGDFARPTSDSPGWDWATPWGWDGGEGKPDGGGTVPASLARRGDKQQAANLHRNTNRSLSTRLWDVRAGAEVELTWEDSPSTNGLCPAGQVGKAQSYSLLTGSGDGRKKEDFQTEKLPGLRQSQWAGRSVTFKATEDEPRITFVSTTPPDSQTSDNCGPMLAKVRATQDPARYDTQPEKTALPPARAYQGNNRTSVNDALSTCKTGRTACAFEIYPWATRPYYDRAQVIDEAYINCSRNAITDKRDVQFKPGGYNSLPVTARDFALTDYQPFRDLVAEEFENYSKYPWVWSTDRTRQIAWNIQPGEVSWVEVQVARERAEGKFTQIVNEKVDSNYETSRYRMFVTFDTPSKGRSDRLYQRSGPLTPDELAKCSRTRPTAITPDNRAVRH